MVLSAACAFEVGDQGHDVGSLTSSEPQVNDLSIGDLRLQCLSAFVGMTGVLEFCLHVDSPRSH